MERDMEPIRGMIDEIFNERAGIYLNDAEWVTILAAIVAAQPPGEDELYVVFQELAEARDERYITIDFFNDRTAVIRSQFTGDGDTVLARCCPTDNLADTVRSLLPKPEPTVEEDAECVYEFVVLHGGAGYDKAVSAANRLRERLEKT